MLKMRAVALLCLSYCLVAWPATPAQQTDQSNINARIRSEENEHSQVMRTMHFLTDVYGPRLTGSPNHKAAAEWAIAQMKSWGFENAHLEPWEFGHPGWTNELLTARALSPFRTDLSCRVLAWTPSTNGVVTARAYQMILPDKPSQEDLDSYLKTQAAKVRGVIVLAGKPAVVPVNLTPPPKRLDDKQAKERFDPNNPNAGQFGNRPGGPPQPNAQQGPPRLTPRQIDEQLDRFLKKNGALLRINDAGREHGQIRAFNNRTFDLSKAVPTVVMRNEDYGRLSRVLADGTPVRLQFQILNRVYPEGRTSYNAIAEIPGTDKKDEIVMLGGHLDSWHSATGATDNAIGCATMMEAARILQAIGARPRRTIRVALWSGEEQGLLGSQAYVKEHFGSFENPKPEFFKLSAYFNIDSGTGRVRGASVFGPPEAATILRQTIAPFEDLGVMGAIATKGRALGGSDNTSFSRAGLPGVSLGQDPIEYGSNTWHTNLDTFERIVEDDAKKSAITIAAAVYALAMSDQLLPRFAKDTMPPLPPDTNAQQPPPATTRGRR